MFACMCSKLNVYNLIALLGGLCCWRSQDCLTWLPVLSTSSAHAYPLHLMIPLSCGKPSHCPVTCSHDTLELLSDGLCCVITCPPEDRGLCLPDLGCGCSFWPNSCLGECSWNEWGGSACRWLPVQGWATPAVYSYLCMVRQACGCFLNCCVVVPSLGSAHWSRMKGNGSTCFCLKNANFFLKCVL